MIFTNILVGMLIGLTMSVPVGPAGIIGVKRIIARGMHAGIASGLGIAIADLIFATFAVAGISSVSEFMISHQKTIQLVGATIIILVGIYGYRKGPVLTDDKVRNRAAAAMKDFTSMLAITLANPQTIIGFSTSFAATVTLYSVNTNSEIAGLVAGVFLGSFTMWAFLSWLISHTRGILQDHFIVKLHRYASAFVIFIGFALIAYALTLG